MKRRILAVMPDSTNYISYYEVSVAGSFEEAKRMIMDAEREGRPFESLDLPVRDERAFWEFLDWMRRTGRNYPFSMFGHFSTARFWRICEEARKKGYIVNT